MTNQQRTAIVTGGARGIGSMVSRRLARRAATSPSLTWTRTPAPGR